MKSQILIPQFGLTESVTLVEWLRGPGDRVEKGEPLVVIETDKVNAEIESPAHGVLEISVLAGADPVAVETVLGYVDDGVDTA